jgi:hypothetical protein
MTDPACDTDLSPQLEASLDGRVVSRYELPTATDINSVHAMLARVTREQRSFRLVAIERNDDGIPQ